MKYRQFGKLDWKGSALGFGCMRLPVIDNDVARIDEPEATRMIRYAIDNGVNYLDTAYVYHQGESEKLLSRALRDGYREKVKIITKMPAMIVQKAEEFDRIFNEQLERLQTGTIDIYLLHGLNRNTWARMKEFGYFNWVEKQMAAGKIARIGFSFHDTYPVFKQIVDGYDNWVMAQLQYNYMDVNSQAGRRGVVYAAGKGLAVVVMEPLRGGKLAKDPPPPVAKVWQGAHRELAPVEWGLQWVWNQPEISVVLSGMNTMAQVEQNVDIAGRSDPGKLSDDDLKLIARVRKAYSGLTPIPCTECKYCQPCPHGVDIPRIFGFYNDAFTYDDLAWARRMYNGVFIAPEARADKCQECGECVEKCPQHIEIPGWLKKAGALLQE